MYEQEKVFLIRLGQIKHSQNNPDLIRSLMKSTLGHTHTHTLSLRVRASMCTPSDPCSRLRPRSGRPVPPSARCICFRVPARVLRSRSLPASTLFIVQPFFHTRAASIYASVAQKGTTTSQRALSQKIKTVRAQSHGTCCARMQSVRSHCLCARIEIFLKCKSLPMHLCAVKTEINELN